MFTTKWIVFFALFTTATVSAQNNISEWLESKLDNNTAMLKEILTILRKGNFDFKVISSYCQTFIITDF